MYIATFTCPEDISKSTDQEDVTKSTSKKVIAKFTAPYNEITHKLLADADLPPKLYFCGQVVGDLYMVVMNYVEKCKSIWQLQVEDTRIPAVVLSKVEAISLLHKADIVFGDLRVTEIFFMN